MIAYIRVQTVDESVWPYPKEDGWIAVQPIDKDRNQRCSMVVPQESLVPASEIEGRIVEMLRKRGWRPP